jgi:hypothetical protein
MAAQGNTTAVGLGNAHQKTRQRALAALQDGDLCARCAERGIEHPMFRSLVTRRPSGLYVAPMLDLDDFPGRRFGGPQIKRLSYRICNRRAGQRAGAAMRVRKKRARAYTRW